MSHARTCIIHYMYGTLSAPCIGVVVIWLVFYLDILPNIAIIFVILCPNLEIGKNSYRCKGIRLESGAVPAAVSILLFGKVGKLQSVTVA